MNKWWRLAGFAGTLVAGGLLIWQLGPKAGGPKSGLMIQTELSGSGDTIAAVPPLPTSMADFLTIGRFFTVDQFHVR